METTQNQQREPLANGAANLRPEDVVIAEIKRALESIEFGSVLIKIHQGEVVGIETSTKVRLKDRR